MASLDRRTFLGAAGAAGLTALAGASVAAQPNDRIRVGVMGTGGRGTGLAQLFQRQTNVEVAYVCDVDAERANRAAGLVQQISNRAPKIVSDFRRMLDDKTIDLMVCATCNHWHAPSTILAVAAGKHVYVEKPCSHNAREGELMVQAARKQRKFVQMGNQRRSYPAVIQAMDRLRKGAIGRVYLAESWYMNNRPTIGRGKAQNPPQGLDYDLWQGPAPRMPFRTNYLHYNWHWFWHWGNGELGNNGVHIIDLCRWGMGVDYPVRVTSSGGRYRFEDDQQTPDTHMVAFEFEGRRMITWEGLSCSRQPNRPYHALFHGDNGTLALSDSSYVILNRAGNKDKEIANEKVAGGDAPHVVNLLNAIRNNGTLNSDIEEAHKTTLLCHLGNIAHRTGRSLRCNGKDGHILDDKAAMNMWTREYEKGWEPRV